MGKGKTNCFIRMCTNASFSTSKIATSEQIAHIFMCENVPYLCKRHYHLVYDTSQSKQTHCCTCNSSLRMFGNMYVLTQSTFSIIKYWFRGNPRGLPCHHGDKDIMVRISTYKSRELCFLQLSALNNALENDPDLSSLQPSLLPQIVYLWQLDVTTSLGIGKSRFPRFFFHLLQVDGKILQVY